MTTNPAILSAAVTRWNSLRASLLQEFPELEEDVLRDTIDGATDALDLVAELGKAAVSDEYVAGMLKAQIADLTARKERFELRAEKRRVAAETMMTVIDVRKVERPELTMFLRSTPPKVVVYDADELPDTLCRITRSPDKTAIREALLRGERVDGAYMSNGGSTLSVKVR